MTIRLFLSAAILLGMYGGVLWVRDRGMPAEQAPVERDLKDLPLTLGDWKGEAVTLDPDIFMVLGAKMAMDRKYIDRYGRAVSAHLAVFDRPTAAQGLIHAPEVCYPSHGWQLGEAKLLPLTPTESPANQVKLLPVQSNGQNAYVLYWYQIDGKAFCTGDQQRKCIQQLRGRPTFPPVVKVMLQTNAANPDQAEYVMMPLAAEIFAWTRDFH